jgi:hypothetical protein
VVTAPFNLWVVSPKDRIVSPARWPHQARITWHNLRVLFGAVDSKATMHGHLAEDLGLACLLAAICGLARVAWARRRASRAEQLLSVGIVCLLGLYTISELARPNNAHELALVLPGGAVLAARAFVPARITRAPAAVAAVVVTAIVAVLPLASAATLPLNVPATTQLTAWLEAHHLQYGLAGYWDADSATVQSHDEVMIHDIDLRAGGGLALPGYEASKLWYDPSLHDARFVVAQRHWQYPVSAFVGFFGRPADSYRIGNYVVLVYRKNLLRMFKPYT